LIKALYKNDNQVVAALNDNSIDRDSQRWKDQAIGSPPAQHGEAPDGCRVNKFGAFC
jgi:hypothetical protein